jgi:hypothetical protein
LIASLCQTASSSSLTVLALILYKNTPVATWRPTGNKQSLFPPALYATLFFMKYIKHLLPALMLCAFFLSSCIPRRGARVENDFFNSNVLQYNIKNVALMPIYCPDATNNDDLREDISYLERRVTDRKVFGRVFDSREVHQKLESNPKVKSYLNRYFSKGLARGTLNNDYNKNLAKFVGADTLLYVVVKEWAGNTVCDVFWVDGPTGDLLWKVKFETPGDISNIPLVDENTGRQITRNEAHLHHYFRGIANSWP